MISALERLCWKEKNTQTKGQMVSMVTPATIIISFRLYSRSKELNKIVRFYNIKQGEETILISVIKTKKGGR